jgi:ketosteroid isomerase-like protein
MDAQTGPEGLWEAERACTRLVLEYARLVDSGRAAGIADLFTDDGVWEGADGRLLRGRTEIRAAFEGRQGLTRRTSRHVCTNVLIDVEGPDAAVGVSYLLNYRHDSRDGAAVLPAPADHPKFVGDYHDRFVRVDGVWRIAHRRFELAFLRARRTPPGG